MKILYKYYAYEISHYISKFADIAELLKKRDERELCKVWEERSST